MDGFMTAIKQHPGPVQVFRAEVGPKKAAAANVESVFSGAGKFTDEAKSAGPKLISRMTKLHYDWKYKFLHPTNKQVVDRYNKSSAQPSTPDSYSQTRIAAAATSSSRSASAGPAVGTREPVAVRAHKRSV